MFYSNAYAANVRFVTPKYITNWKSFSGFNKNISVNTASISRASSIETAADVGLIISLTAIYAGGIFAAVGVFSCGLIHFFTARDVSSPGVAVASLGRSVKVAGKRGGGTLGSFNYKPTAGRVSAFRIPKFSFR